MAEMLTCPRGHRFDITAAGAHPSARTLGATSDSVTCPVCGAPCDTSPEIRIPSNEPSVEATPTTFSALPLGADAVTGEAPKSRAVLRPSPRAPLHTIPGYEFLEKLGQGGMGVVFKARQTGLNRVVALKMILASYSDNPQELARFQIEAEALASLQHPNIVQVYDVGAYEGSPFFAMEFVDGASLDRRLDGKPMAPREAARLIEMLARAMHAAHQRGIIHRDLKPVNVLLTHGGTPKIVDFGLAKRLEDHDDRTLPGAILGTPSYMAPEQAFGKSRDVGPATDVHALGTMMYEMLTGQQPFRGGSALTTLENVRKVDPPAPSKHQPAIPRDLDVICLKCLQKDPARRYATAEALANDLCRFREG
ncbi:MAG TPA: serine/threonine-protein kinase, partial [Gemmataceae bacterium]|nr:serine/threonine-protein kinase [Gemmataceae bacterium]